MLDAYTEQNLAALEKLGEDSEGFDKMEAKTPYRP